MRFSLTEDEEMIVASVRDLCAKTVTRQAAAWDAAGALPDAVIDGLGAMGLLGMSAPEAHGGVALSCVGRAAVLEALAGGDAALAMVVAMHDSLAVGHLARAGSQAQQQEHLPAWASAEALATWCPPGPALRATVREDGGVSLRGETPVTVGAVRAQWLVVNAAVADGVESMLVPRDCPGLRIVPVSRLGLRAGGAGRVVFDAGTTVAAAWRLGTASDGVTATVQSEYFVALAAIACGVGRAALRAATVYATEREQFGRPIAQFQAIAWKLANAATELDAAALLTARAAWGLDTHAPDRAAPARAKLLATRAAQRACSGALQIHGGYGYTREFPIERALRAAKSLAIAAGTQRAARAAVARALPPA